MRLGKPRKFRAKHGADRSRRLRCWQCARIRGKDELFSRRGLCEDCGTLNLLAWHFGRGKHRKITVIEPGIGRYEIAYLDDTPNVKVA